MKLGSNTFRVRRLGLTLIETCLAIVIIGVGITASVQLLGTSTANNAFASQQTVGLYLANNIREMLAAVAYCNPKAPTFWGIDAGKTFSGTALMKGELDLDDFDGATWGFDVGTSPIDALWQPVASQTFATTTGQPFATLGRYTQVVTVEKLAKSDLKTVLNTTDPDQGVRYVRVDIMYRPPNATASRQVYSVTFLRFADQRQK